MTRIKVCGVRTAEVAAVAVEAGADAIGLVIDVPHSPRCLTLDEAREIAATVPPRVMTIAVLADPPAHLADGWAGSWIQLHGDEDDELIAHVARTRHVIKGFRYSAEAVRRWNDCPAIDILLVDGSGGGRGVAFPHEALATLMPEISKPVILAGGLTPDNVGDAVRAVRPFAVDVSSGVESAPGIKDPDLIRRFCEAVGKSLES